MSNKLARRQTATVAVAQAAVWRGLRVTLGIEPRHAA